MVQEPDKVTANPALDEHRTAATAPSPVTSTEIRSQIEHTRAEMSHTIDAIQARLRPRRLITDAKQTVKDATVGRVKRLASRTNGNVGSGTGGFFDTDRVISAVKTNPIPVALVGVAATALIVRTVARFQNGADDNPQHSRGRHREQARTTANGNRRRFLAGACAGLACWTAWRTRQSGFSLQEGGQALAGPAASPPFQPRTPLS
jgi:hypothetical protein